MDLKVTIKNLGKLIDADIRINKFTVFAGTNNTGKSFASKALYSRLSCNPDFFDRLERYAERLRWCLEYLKNQGFIDDSASSNFRRKIDDLDKVIVKINDMQTNKISLLEKIAPAFVLTCESIETLGVEMVSKVAKNEALGESDVHAIVGQFESCCLNLGNVAKNSIRDNVSMDMRSIFIRNLWQNFQVKRLSELMNDKDKNTYINIGEESLMFGQEGQEEYVMGSDIFIVDKVFYLGSPLFWQLKNTLESVDDGKSHLKSRQRILGAPKYFYDMAATLKKGEYTGESIFSNVADRLTGENVINGKVSVSATGEMIYTENNGTTVPLSRAATGIPNLGMLALLIERNILEKGAFIFMDEPEAHLHPEWQVEMAEALFNLAEAGVHVVIATHSAEILKWLEVHVKENPEAKEMIALNHFRKDGNVEINGGDFDERLDTIQKELAMPYYSLFYRGL